jgi:hypothetical protein
MMAMVQMCLTSQIPLIPWACQKNNGSAMISKRIPQDVNEVSGTPIIKNHDGVW